MVRTAICLSFVLVLFLFRPAALGQNFAAVGLAVVAFLTVCYLALYRLRPDKAITRDLVRLSLLVGAYLVYECAISIALGRSNLEFVAKELVITLVVVSCYGAFLVNFENNVSFFRQFTTVVALLGWSSAITFGATFFLPQDNLELFRFDMEGYERTEAGTIYLPFSMAYGVFTTKDIVLMRFTGFFREAGIYQAIAAYCLVLAILDKRSWFVRLGLIAGSICTFSTIGIATLIASLGAGYWLTRRLRFTKLAVSLIFAVGGVYAALFAPVIGLVDKFDTHTTSVSDRQKATIKGMERFADNPFGYGAYSTRKANENITLIASLGAIGLAGFLLQLAILSGIRGWGEVSKRRAGACFPLLVTALFSQPIAGSAVLYVLVMAWTGNYETRRRHHRAPAAVKIHAEPSNSTSHHSPAFKAASGPVPTLTAKAPVAAAVRTTRHLSPFRAPVVERVTARSAVMGVFHR